MKIYCILCGKTFEKNDRAVCGGQHNGKPICGLGNVKKIPKKENNHDKNKGSALRRGFK